MQSVLITGAARGLGLALAERYAARSDHRVFAVARDPSAARELRDLARRSAALEIIGADVTVADDVAALAEHVVRSNVRLDLLVNNAGAADYTRLGELDDGVLERTMRVNAFAPLLLVQALRASFATSAKIVNITSILGSIELADGSAGFPYRMSKAALNMATKQLAHTLRRDGIAVLALHPGWVRTRMGGRRATLDIASSADGMVATIDAFSLADTGAYRQYDGTRLPW